MPPIAHTILLVFAICCFGLSAMQVAAPNWNRLISIGLTALTLSFLSF